MPMLTCPVSETLMQALTARSVRTGESLAHIVMSALADALGVEHSTLFQISTSAALVKGVYDGVVRIGELKQHGDFGLGTFDGLDGELLAVDGRFYQIHGNGAVTEPDDDARVPFAVITAFRPERRLTIAHVADLADLLVQLDSLRQTENLFYAVRLDGHFTSIKTRAACKAAPGESLVAATAHQSEFTFTDVLGTLVGFWTPLYARTLNIAGWHLHFINDTRTDGGHLLDCRADNLSANFQHLPNVRIAMPETAAFLQADLTRDPTSDLNVAERGRTRPT